MVELTARQFLDNLNETACDDDRREKAYDDFFTLSFQGKSVQLAFDATTCNGLLDALNDMLIEGIYSRSNGEEFIEEGITADAYSIERVK